MSKVKSEYIKVFVKDSGESNIQVLRYILQNIEIINQMGVKVSITKINKSDLDKKLVTKLQSKNIVRFPSIVYPDGKVISGHNNIKKIFDKKSRQFQNYLKQSQEKNNEFNVGSSDNADLSQFYKNEMNFAAYKDDNGKDDTAIGDNPPDYNRRITDQMASRKLKPGTVPASEDNIALDDEEPYQPKRDNKGAMGMPPRQPTSNNPDDIFDQRFSEMAYDDNGY